MMKSKILPAVLALLASTPLLRGAGHDMYVCAAVNSDYVIGSTYVTMSGLFHREADGTWRHIGFNDVGIMAVSFDPRDHDTFYTATLNGLVRTFDADRHIRVTTSWDVTEIKDVCVDPNAPDHVYLAAPDGVMVTTNRADTWERRETGLPERGKYAQTIEVDRTTAGRVLVGCETGIYLTTDAAAHWERVLPTVDTVTDIQQSPHDAKVWFATTQSAGVWRSADGGVSWTAVTGLPKDKACYNVSFDATNPARIAVGSYTYGVMVSVDGGQTWTDRNVGLPDEHHVWRVAIDPDTGRLYANVRAKDVFQSDDFGRTWTSAGLPGSQVCEFVFVPKPAK